MASVGGRLGTAVAIQVFARCLAYGIRAGDGDRCIKVEDSVASAIGARDIRPQNRGSRRIVMISRGSVACCEKQSWEEVI